jgi:hypothetical protein
MERFAQGVLGECWGVFFELGHFIELGQECEFDLLGPLRGGWRFQRLGERAELAELARIR